MTLPIVILISGNGSNLQAIIDAIANYQLPVTIKAVISSDSSAYGLIRAKSANIPTHTLSGQNFNTREEYDNALIKLISPYTPELIVLAGFMRILSNTFLKHFENKIINIHPSLLPKYPGLDTHKKALEENCSEHGCSIHYVNENLDGGPLIAQAIISIKPNETVQTLKNKVHIAEHFLYPTTLNWFAKKRIKIENNTVIMDEIPIPKLGYCFLINR